MWLCYYLVSHYVLMHVRLGTCAREAIWGACLFRAQTLHLDPLHLSVHMRLLKWQRRHRRFYCW